MMKTVRGVCPICKQTIGEFSSSAIAARSVGVHKRFAHGIRGASGAEKYWIAKGMTLEQAKAHIASRRKAKIANPGAEANREKWKAYQRKWVAKERKAQQNGETVLARLTECPCCGARFYYVKGQ